MSSRSLLSFPPTDVPLGVAFPPVGPVGPGSTPSRSAFGLQTLGPMLHYDCPSPLSHRFTWRGWCDTWPASAICVPSPARGRPEATRPRQGSWSPGTPPLPGNSVQETTGSPKFPSDPLEDMPRSQTPVVSCVPRPCASRTTAFRPLETVGFPLHPAEGYPLGPPRYQVRGSITRPVTLLPLAPRRPYWLSPEGSLLTGWRGVRPVGLAPAVRPHWVTITGFMDIHPIPRFRAFLARPVPG